MKTEEVQQKLNKLQERINEVYKEYHEGKRKRFFMNIFIVMFFSLVMTFIINYFCK